MLWTRYLCSTERHVCLISRLSVFLFRILLPAPEVGVTLQGKWMQEGAESHCGCILPGTAQRRGLAGSHLLREAQHQALHTWQVPTTRQASGMPKRHAEAKAVHCCQ